MSKKDLSIIALLLAMATTALSIQSILIELTPPPTTTLDHLNKSNSSNPDEHNNHLFNALASPLPQDKQGQ